MTKINLPLTQEEAALLAMMYAASHFAVAEAHTMSANLIKTIEEHSTSDQRIALSDKLAAINRTFTEYAKVIS